MSVYEPIKIVKMTNMEVDIKVDKVANMVADREVDKVADMVAYLRGRHSFNQMFTILTILFFFLCVEMFITGLWGTDGYRENAKFHSFHTINFWRRDVFILMPGGEH